MEPLVKESRPFIALKWILLVSNITSAIIDLLVIIGGRLVVNLFSYVPDDYEPPSNDIMIRIFCAIELIICIIGIVGIIKRHFITFSVHTGLLILYFLAAIIFTRILISWFVFLAIVLSALTLTFLYMLWKGHESRTLHTTY